MVIDTKPVSTVSCEQWLSALVAHRNKEKALTAKLDALAAERRRLPRECIDGDYEFDAPGGRLGLRDLFDGRSQLIVYHHMLKPADEAPCSGCGMFGDQIPHLTHLHARDTSLVFVASAPLDEIETLKARLGWHFPFVSTSEAFNRDFGVATGFGLNVFLQKDGAIYRTYFTTGRGVETLGTPGRCSTSRPTAAKKAGNRHRLERHRAHHTPGGGRTMNTMPSSDMTLDLPRIQP